VTSIWWPVLRFGCSKQQARGRSNEAGWSRGADGEVAGAGARGRVSTRQQQASHAGSRSQRPRRGRRCLYFTDRWTQK